MGAETRLETERQCGPKRFVQELCWRQACTFAITQARMVCPQWRSWPVGRGAVGGQGCSEQSKTDTELNAHPLGLMDLHQAGR